MPELHFMAGGDLEIVQACVSQAPERPAVGLSFRKRFE
jgi:hypothetical protein